MHVIESVDAGIYDPVIINKYACSMRCTGMSITEKAWQILQAPCSRRAKDPVFKARRNVMIGVKEEEPIKVEVCIMGGQPPLTSLTIS